LKHRSPKKIFVLNQRNNVSKSLTGGGRPFDEHPADAPASAVTRASKRESRTPVVGHCPCLHSGTKLIGGTEFLGAQYSLCRRERRDVRDQRLEGVWNGRNLCSWYHAAVTNASALSAVNHLTHRHNLRAVRTLRKRVCRRASCARRAITGCRPK
jgi:hypothetical protein